MRIEVIKLKEENFFGKVLPHNVVAIVDDGLTLVDTSLPQNLDQLERGLRNIGFSLDDVGFILLTHSHPDHVGNAEIIRRISHAKIIAHKLEDFTLKEFNLKYEDVVNELNVSRDEFESTVKRINEITYEPPRIDVRVNGGEEIAGFRIMHVPGHTPGHIALFNGETLITGDALRVDGGIRPPLPFFNWDQVKALKSFNFLISLPFKRLIPYHGELN
jgi:glyoxylase-like metal-dependent hydrolase (beta-lactamase superfamily II)